MQKTRHWYLYLEGFNRRSKLWRKKKHPVGPVGPTEQNVTTPFYLGIEFGSTWPKKRKMGVFCKKMTFWPQYFLHFSTILENFITTACARVCSSIYMPKVLQSVNWALNMFNYRRQGARFATRCEISFLPISRKLTIRFSKSKYF